MRILLSLVLIVVGSLFLGVSLLTILNSLDRQYAWAVASLSMIGVGILIMPRTSAGRGFDVKMK